MNDKIKETYNNALKECYNSEEFGDEDCDLLRCLSKNVLN